MDVSIIFHFSLFSEAAAPGTHQVSERVKLLAEEIPKLNLIEVNDLLKALQVCAVLCFQDADVDFSCQSIDWSSRIP